MYMTQNIRTAIGPAWPLILAFSQKFLAETATLYTFQFLPVNQHKLIGIIFPTTDDLTNAGNPHPIQDNP